jgi:heme-degrading monooxygenase HmoA
MPAGFNTDTYDAVNEKARVSAEPPKGLLFHSLGTSADGHLIIDIWESEQDFDDFRTSRLNPAMESVVGSEAFAAMPTPERDIYEVHNLVRP